jgi:hypothetical protein
LGPYRSSEYFTQEFDREGPECAPNSPFPWLLRRTAMPHFRTFKPLLAHFVEPPKGLDHIREKCSHEVA